MNGRQAGFWPQSSRIWQTVSQQPEGLQRYSEGYLASLETTVGMAALYAEDQGWPDVQEITTEHLEDYLAYLQDRTRWFGERTYAEPKLKPRWDVHLSGDDDQLGYAGESLSSVLGE